ncbi:cell division protein ZapE [Pontibaca salina]|uniref:AFG1 family ATPase n=1 Tax=Pontibaca salina TaxID=2795731 RepID=A0A934HR30_9RHOB|nr:cell division protein ZapE [Pontibaca salina]MBI6629361.1 AFG1 family ATPase [Pontibaca salina]
MKDLPALYKAGVADGSLTPDPAQEVVLPEFERIRAELARPVRRGLFRKPPAPPKGLYLWGGVGRGKSMLMDLFVSSLGGVPRRRVHFHVFMQEVHAALHQARMTEVEDSLGPVAARMTADLRLLAFDEMQITDITDAMLVGRLFQTLLDAGVTIVTTSNRPPDDLYKDGLNRQLFLPFIDLIKSRMAVQELASPTDHRQNRLAGTQTYFTPAGADAHAAIETIWQDLAGGEGRSLTLTVNKRDITLPQCRNGVARASFYDLCANPLGPADYLAIADAVRVLILEDIPRLSRSNFNAARRFVTLVDALYEARVRLIVSADAQPESLYVEGDGAFEFERTASRLREMQSADWAG